MARTQVPPTVTQLPLRDWRCFYLLLTLNQPQLLQPAEEPRTEAWSLPTEHRCAKPLEYPCAGEARTDHPGGLPLSDRQKGKSRGESMAVEEEGLRIFQSVKIKIGKKENTPPPPTPTPSSLCASTHGCVLTGRAGRQAARAGESRATRLLTAVVYNSNHTFVFFLSLFPSAQSRWTTSCKIMNAKTEKVDTSEGLWGNCGNLAAGLRNQCQILNYGVIRTGWAHERLHSCADPDDSFPFSGSSLIT